MLLMIDNYDSFTWNLVQYFGELGHLPEVIRNDVKTVTELAAMNPTAVVISPGPCSPKEAGVSCEAIEYFANKGIPVFGVCLGMQSIVDVYGGTVGHAPYLMHGKVSPIKHNGKGIFKDIPSPYNATRYHSLCALGKLPDCLEITAETEDGIVMGVQHKTLPVYGVQYHPESILTEHGHQLLDNFLKLSGVKK
jgi:anthranilate synthase component II